MCLIYLIGLADTKISHPFVWQLGQVQLGGIPSPVGWPGFLLWLLWMLGQLGQFVTIFSSMVLTAVSFTAMQAQMHDCMLKMPMLDAPILTVFSRATFVFLPVIIVKLLTLVVYWLALYNGGRAWELRPRLAKAIKVSVKNEDKSAAPEAAVAAEAISIYDAESVPDKEQVFIAEPVAAAELLHRVALETALKEIVPLAKQQEELTPFIFWEEADAQVQMQMEMGVHEERAVAMAVDDALAKARSKQAKAVAEAAAGKQAKAVAEESAGNDQPTTEPPGALFMALSSAVNALQPSSSEGTAPKGTVSPLADSARDFFSSMFGGGSVRGSSPAGSLDPAMMEVVLRTGPEAQTFTIDDAVLGIAMQDDGGGVVVAKLKPGAQAEMLGVPIGGRIVSINGETAANTKESIMPQLQSAARPTKLIITPPNSALTNDPSSATYGIGLIKFATKAHITVELTECGSGMGVGLNDNNCVTMLVPGKPAAKHLQVGDKVVEFDDQPMAGRKLSDVAKPSDKHTLKLQRDREMVLVETVDATSANVGVMMPNDEIVTVGGVDVRNDYDKTMAQLGASKAMAGTERGVACTIVRMPPSPTASPPPLPSPPASPPESGEGVAPLAPAQPLPASNAAAPAATLAKEEKVPSPRASPAAANASPAKPPGQIALGVSQEAGSDEGISAIANERLRELHEKRKKHRLINSLQAPKVVGQKSSWLPMKILGSMHIFTFYVLVFVTVVVWIFSGAFAFLFLFLPIAMLNALWFALIYQVLIRVWLFSKVRVHHTLPHIPPVDASSLSSSFSHTSHLVPPPLSPLPHLISPSRSLPLLAPLDSCTTQEVIEQSHVQRINKLLTLRNDLDNKIIDLTKKERTQTGKPSMGDRLKRKIKTLTGATKWEQPGKVFMQTVDVKPLDTPPKRSIIDKILFRKPKPPITVTKEEADQHEIDCEIEQIYTKLCKSYTSFSPTEKYLLNYSLQVDSMLWWLEGRPPTAFARFKLFTGLGLLWAYTDEFQRRYNLARASQSRAAKDFMLRYLRGNKADEFRSMLVKLHILQRERERKLQDTWYACLIGWFDCCGIWSFVCGLKTKASADGKHAEYPPEYLALRKDAITKLLDFKDDRCLMMFEEKRPGCCSRIVRGLFKICGGRANDKLDHGDHLSPEEVGACPLTPKPRAHVRTRADHIRFVCSADDYRSSTCVSRSSTLRVT